MSYNFGLTRGTTLIARFQVTSGANGTIKVLFLDSANFQRFQAHQQYTFFQGTSGPVRNTGQYVFRAPLDDIYYLVLDNSGAWLLPRDVNLYVYNVLPAKLPETLASERTIEENFSKLGELFIFPSFQLEIKHCGVVNAFSNPNITICTELVETLHDQNLDQAIAFVLFHELGHTLLRQWNYPLWGNEDAADEFATVLMILGKQQQIALQAAQWWVSQTSEQEAASKLWVDDRHTISPQRAWNIVHWLNQPNDLPQRWFSLVVPNMQTSALISTLNDASAPINRELLKAELKKRGCIQ
jgi:Zn-dependent protease with chaperone function